MYLINFINSFKTTIWIIIFSKTVLFCKLIYNSWSKQKKPVSYNALCVTCNKKKPHRMQESHETHSMDFRLYSVLIVIVIVFFPITIILSLPTIFICLFRLIARFVRHEIFVFSASLYVCMCVCFCRNVSFWTQHVFICAFHFISYRFVY